LVEAAPPRRLAAATSNRLSSPRSAAARRLARGVALAILLAPGAQAPAPAAPPTGGAAPAPAAVTKEPALSYTPGLDPAAIDRRVDPCVDFFAFACGGWLQANPIPVDESGWSVYSKLADENVAFLRQILEAAARPLPQRDLRGVSPMAGAPTDLRGVSPMAGAATDQVTREIGDFYAACMDEETIERSGSAPLAAALAEIAAIASRDDLARAVAHLQMASEAVPGASAPFRLDSTQDFKDSSQVIAEISQSGLGLPDRDYYTREDAKSAETRQRYTAHVARMLALLGEPPAAAAADAAAILRLETALAKASLTRVERRDPANIYHRLSRAQLVSLTPSFAWDAYFAAVSGPALRGFGDMRGMPDLPDLPDLNIAEPGFMQGLETVLEKEDLATWRAYLRWHLVRHRADLLSSPFVAEHFDFYGRYLQGSARLQPRFKRCVQAVDRNLGEALGKAFVARAFSAGAKQRTLAMVGRIEQAMERDLRELDWMSPATKEQALRKLREVSNKIGYPDRWRDYGSIQISRTDHAGNVERAARFERRRRLDKIGRPLDRGEWAMTPPTVNAYYDPSKNAINFPAGILQPPLFDPRMDDAPNYGDTGATIGHELTHGFDDAGRKFDGAGNLRDWWSPADAREFERRASCMAEQYSRYTIVGDVKINGRLTLGENVADLGGLLLAYMAWQDATRGQQLAPLDGLRPEQRFFVGYAQSFCGSVRDERARMLATTDPHSPDRYRVNGVVSDLPAFGAAFSCKPGQPMMPEKTCRVW
jgi:putative endopeptidase